MLYAASETGLKSCGLTSCGSGVPVGVLDAVGVTVGVSVAVAVAVGVKVSVGVLVGVSVGSRITLMFMLPVIRTISADTQPTLDPATIWYQSPSSLTPSTTACSSRLIVATTS